MVIISFNSYVCHIRSGVYNRPGVSFNHQNRAPAVIFLMSDTRSYPVGRLLFCYDEEEANARVHWEARAEGGFTVFVTYHISMLQSIVDMLRNEKPVYLVCPQPDEDLYWLPYLSTTSEPVGEGE
jgi:hypothetical protein